MSFTSLLVANRGEIAIRIIRAASDLGLRTVAIYSTDDAESLHTRVADEAHALDGRGVPPYLDIDGVIAAAQATSSSSPQLLPRLRSSAWRAAILLLSLPTAQLFRRLRAKSMASSCSLTISVALCGYSRVFPIRRTGSMLRVSRT